MSNELLQQFCQWFQQLDEPQRFDAGRQFKEHTGGTLSAYCNPKPVAVALVVVKTPEGERLLGLRRAIEPRKGTVVLPGGFMEEGEQPEEATAREVLEETGIAVQAERFAPFGRPVAAGGGTLLMFYRSSVCLSHGEFLQACERFEASSDGEAMDLVLIGPGAGLGFPLHQAAAAQFFEG